MSTTLATSSNLLELEGAPENDQHFVAEKLQMMGFTQSSLARRLSELGDHRNYGSTLKSIQRVAAGETRLTAELRVILTMLGKDWMRASRQAAQAVWNKQPSGTLYTESREFDIYLMPQSGSRWKVHLSHQPTKYSPSWIEWQDTLEVAKVRAFVQLDDTWLDIHWPESIAAKLTS